MSMLTAFYISTKGVVANTRGPDIKFKSQSECQALSHDFAFGVAAPPTFHKHQLLNSAHVHCDLTKCFAHPLAQLALFECLLVLYSVSLEECTSN
jgi:hypothetical protein